MAPRKPKVFTTTVAGVQYQVLDSKPDYWVTRSSDSGVSVHLGKLLDAPAKSVVLDAPKKCARCKTNAWSATHLKRARHDGCEGWLETLPDDVFATVVFDTSLALAEAETDPAVELLQRSLGARPRNMVEVSLPASRVSPRLASGVHKAAARFPGGFGLQVKLFNAGFVMTLPTPHFVAPAILDRLNQVFGPTTTTIRG